MLTYRLIKVRFKNTCNYLWIIVVVILKHHFLLGRVAEPALHKHCNDVVLHKKALTAYFGRRILLNNQ